MELGSPPRNHIVEVSDIVPYTRFTSCAMTIYRNPTHCHEVLFRWTVCFFLQKFLPVTICPIQSVGATLAKSVCRERRCILAPSVNLSVTKVTVFMVLVSSSVTTMDLGSPLRSLTVKVSDIRFISDNAVAFRQAISALSFIILFPSYCV